MSDFLFFISIVVSLLLGYLAGLIRNEQQRIEYNRLLLDFDALVRADDQTIAELEEEIDNLTLRVWKLEGEQ